VRTRDRFPAVGSKRFEFDNRLPASRDNERARPTRVVATRAAPATPPTHKPRRAPRIQALPPDARSLRWRPIRLPSVRPASSLPWRSLRGIRIHQHGFQPDGSSSPTPGTTSRKLAPRRTSDRASDRHCAQRNRFRSRSDPHWRHLRLRRRLFVTGTALFGASSLACGLAGSEDVLIGARLAQGLGAAMLTPAALSILTTTFADGRLSAR
jgi:hypothetical protein